MKNSSKFKRCKFSLPLCFFVYLDWLSCPHLFVSRSDVVPTCHCLHSWEKPDVKKHLTFPLDVPGDSSGQRGAPRPLPPSRILTAALEANTQPKGGRQEICPGGKLSSLALELVPQPKNEVPEEEWGWLEVVPAGRAGSHWLRAAALQKTLQ